MPAVRGTVTDSSGAAVANATVHLVNPANNSDRTATTDQRGNFAFSGVPAGTYRLVVDAQGFEEFVRNDVVLVVNAPNSLDVQLKIRQVQQNVTVNAPSGDVCLTATKRVLPDVGAGLRSIRRGPSGNYYVLTAPGSAIAVYSPDGKRIGQVPSLPAAQSAPDSRIGSGSAFQVDSAGYVYVADFAAGEIKIYSPNGTLQKKMRVPLPISVEPFSDGNIAVESLTSKHLVDVYDGTLGTLYDSFGEVDHPETAICDTMSLQCSLPASKNDASDAKLHTNLGWFYGDSSGNVYVSLVDSPDPTLRKYDSYGYLQYETVFPLSRILSGKDSGKWQMAPEVVLPGMGMISASQDPTQSCTTSSVSSPTAAATTEGQCSGRPTMGGGEMGGGGMHGGGGMAMGGMGGGMGGPGGGMDGMHSFDHGGGGMGGRGMSGGSYRFGLRLTQRAGAADAEPGIDAIGVDPANQEVWAAIDGNLIHYEADGTLAGYYCLSSSDRAPIKPITILVEPNRILIGTDPFGIFEYPRPDKPAPDSPAH